MVPLAHSFTGEPLLNSFLGPEQSSIQKGNTDLIKAQSAITREREKEMKKVISMYRVPLATGHCIYMISFGSHSNFYSQIDIIIPCGPWDRSLGSQIIWSGLKTGRKQSQDPKLHPTPESLLLCYSAPLFRPSLTPTLKLGKSLCIHALGSLTLLEQCLPLILGLPWKISCNDLT